MHGRPLDPRFQVGRRLVGIARTVASGPSIVILDEPAAGLDETESRELAGLIRRLAHERRMGILLVEHDVPLVMSTCDRIVCIDEHNPYFHMIRSTWGQKLRQVFESIDEPQWGADAATYPLRSPSRYEPMGKIHGPGDKIV